MPKPIQPAKLLSLGVRSVVFLGVLWLHMPGGVFCQTAPPASKQEQHAMQPCKVAGVEGTARCGSYEVFENRRAKRGRKISLSLVVLPALTAKAAADPLFIFAGGPGQAATDSAAGYAQMFAAIRKTRDLVLIDQRGTGRSHPLNCELNDLNEIIQAIFGGNLPLEKLKQCRQELSRDADLRFYTTPIAVDDADEIRGWLGYERINIYGSSYGSRAPLLYLRQHPNRVRAIVVRALAPQNYKNPLYNPRDAQRSFDVLVADCARDANCARSFPSLPEDLQTILNRLSRSPVTVIVPNAADAHGDEVVITRDVFAGALRRALLDASSQRQIPLMLKKALAGDFKNFETFFGFFRSVTKSLSLGLNLSVICTEDIPFIKSGEIERQTRGTFLGDQLVRSLVQACRSWPRGVLDKHFQEPIRSKVPALIISGQLDPDAAPAWGNQVARSLPNSLHLVIEGMSHLSPTKCALQVMNQFIENGSPTSLDTSCIKTSQRPAFIIP